MTPAALKKLTEVSQAMQDADAARLAAIRAEEQRIRAQLAALDHRQKNAHDIPISETLPLRRVGGDMLWQVWVGRRRRELQMQLARCLARQGTARRALQKSFGKRFALEKVQSDMQAKADQADKAKAFKAMTGMSVLQRSD